MQCTLREWRREYADALAGLINNLKVQENLRDGIPYPYTTEDANYFLDEMIAADRNRVIAFAVFADDTLCGSISVVRQENIHFRTGELGYYIGEPFWGHGIGTEAIRQICTYVFEHTDIIRIFAEPFAYNGASCRILEKNGFVYEGTLRCNAVKNGRILDMKMYARLKGVVPGETRVD